MADPLSHRLSYRPAEGSGLRHDPLSAIVGPRPIGWISTVSATGVANLAPYSFFNLFNYKPPILGFASIGAKDTVRNVQATGEFVYNLATRPLAEAVNASSVPAPPDVSEFDLAGLTRRPSVLVRPPAVAESPVAFECKVIQCWQMQDAQGQRLDTWMVLGEAIMIHVDHALLSGPEGTYDTLAARPILRGGGAGDYFEPEAAGQFFMARPKA
jgi:flavin reductase (DIM6/NTAB) family NADH-FMN oxidoreductase RutF